MGDIAFYIRQRPFLGNRYPRLAEGLTIYNLSGAIRGTQIAEYLGAKVNPKTFDGIRIFVKPRHLDKVRDGDYVDFSDGAYLGLEEKLKERPGINVITHTLYSYEYLRERLVNKMFLIQQQHLNWERSERNRNGVTRGGYIGRPSPACKKINDEIKEILSTIGQEFHVCHDWRSREDAVRFYQDIDYLVIGGHGVLDANDPWTTPTKMINAASFGVPSIAYWRAAYKEWDGNYFVFETNQDLVDAVSALSSEPFYDNRSTELKEKADYYHISNVAERYRCLT